MTNDQQGWAAWHPEKGFADRDYEGPIAFADLCPTLVRRIREMNEDDGTNHRTGWRAVRVTMRRIAK